MGLTLHFGGRIRNPRQMPELMEEVADICRSMDWDYRLYDEILEVPAKALPKEPGKRDPKEIHLQGISFTPPDCETCSGIALTFWNRRMNLPHGDAKYADLVELTMYNSGISGVSLSGDRFFYTNPLKSDGKHRRRAWFNPPCCPTNMVRFLPEIGSVIYVKTDHTIYINQFIGSEATIVLADNEISLIQETGYPWDGRISLKVDPSYKSFFFG